MLSSEPAANSGATTLWNRMHAFNETFCNEYFLKAYDADYANPGRVPSLPMWDNSSYGAVIYDEWDCTNATESPGKCYGMHYDRVNGSRHGVVRIEYNNGSIEEGTWYGFNGTG